MGVLGLLQPGNVIGLRRSRLHGDRRAARTCGRSQRAEPASLAKAIARGRCGGRMKKAIVQNKVERLRRHGTRRCSDTWVRAAGFTKNSGSAIRWESVAPVAGQISRQYCHQELSQVR